jgi:hypothetical protein
VIDQRFTLKAESAGSVIDELSSGKVFEGFAGVSARVFNRNL